MKAQSINQKGSKRRRVRPAAVAGAALAAAALVAPATASAGGAVLRLDQPGERAFVAPQGVNEFTVHANGAKGQDGWSSASWSAPGGFGNLVWGHLQVGSSRSFAVQVGVGGGVGDGGEGAGAGGGYSGISRCPVADTSCGTFGSGIASRLIVAAGGGGGGGKYGGGRGGAAGAAGGAGYNGDPSGSYPGHHGFGGGGQPGTLTAGGTGGTPAPFSEGGTYPGTLGGGGGSAGGGGGGGGGYYGGGAGGRGWKSNFEGPGGGGGGSTWISASATGRATFPSTDAKPWVELSYIDPIGPKPTIGTPDRQGSIPQRAALSGSAGIDTGDDKNVTLELYDGQAAYGTPVKTLSGPVEAGSGDWFIELPSLPPGLYTARVKQSDLGSNSGSADVTFFLEAPQPKPPVDPPADPPADPPTDPPADQPKDQPADQPKDQPADQPKDQPADQPGDHVDQHPQDQADEHQPANEQAQAPEQQPAPTGSQQGSAPQGASLPAQRRAMLRLSVRKRRLRSALGRGVAATATCDSSCAVQVRLVLPAKLAKRYGLGNGRADVVVATGRASADGRPATVIARFTTKARKRLAKAHALRLRLEASSTGTAPVTRTITLR